MRGVILFGASLVGAILFRLGADIGLAACGWVEEDDTEYQAYRRGLKDGHARALNSKPVAAGTKTVTTPTTTEPPK